jgi:hypothetical protein
VKSSGAPHDGGYVSSSLIKRPAVPARVTLWETSISNWAGGPLLRYDDSAIGFESLNKLTGGAPLLALFEKWAATLLRPLWGKYGDRREVHRVFRNNYHPNLLFPATKSKCRSRLSSGNECCRQSAAIQISLAGGPLKPGFGLSGAVLLAGGPHLARQLVAAT